MKELKVARIYPKYLNANGDIGNIYMLRERAEINKVDFSFEDIDISQKISANNYDFFYIGGSPDEFNPIATRCLLENKSDFLEIQDLNKTLLGVGFGYQILGKNYNFLSGHQINCLGLLDFFTIEKNTRHTGNVTSQMMFMTPNFLVGFENHKGSTYLDKRCTPLSYINKGFGNNGSDKTEGAMSGFIYGTYLCGPLLPRNVFFADYLLKITMENKYQEEFSLLDETDTLEEALHEDFIHIKY